MHNIPKQKIVRSKKTAAWAKDSIKAFINRSSFGPSRKHVIQKYYEAYNGTLLDEDYSYVTNPYNSTKKAMQRFPAKIRNYNIIKPIVDLLHGEKAERPLNHQVVVRNADIETRMDTERKEKYKAFLEQVFINEANERGIDTGQPTEELPVPEEFMEEVLANYKDSRAIIGQEVLDYLFDSLSLEDKMQKMFFDWLVSGSVFTYKDVSFDDVVYDVVSPLDIDYEASPDVDFVEDADWVVRRKIMSINQVVDQFYDVLTPKEIDNLEAPSGDFRDSRGGIVGLLAGNPSHISDRMVEVFHVCWKSFARVGIKTYIDEMGQEQSIVVDESYKKDEGEEIEYFWVSEVMEGYQIDRDTYIGIGPHKVQRNEMNNISICKMPYNGRLYSNRHAENISVISMGMPYQILYNVFHYRLELSIAKNKDKIMLMEMNTIPKRHGWDEEKFMYYADAMGFAFIDSTAEGKRNERVSFNQFQVLDMSLGQYIAAQFQLLQAIKSEWEELLGITRQRKGNISASDGVGVTERAIFQSSVISEELFRKFEVFIEREYNGLIDTSKVAWRKGKKMTYVTSDLRTAMISVDPAEYQETEYGIFVKNSGKEQEKLSQIKQMTQAFAQNGQMPSTVAEILDSNNFSKIKRHLATVEAKMQEMKDAQAKAEQENQQAMMAAQKAEKEADQAFEASENEKDRVVKLTIKTMDVAGKTVSDADGNGRRDDIDKARLEIEREKVALQRSKS